MYFLSNRKDSAEQKILFAAFKLFAHLGFENTSVKAIAQESGYTSTHIYNFYKNKEHILEDLSEEINHFMVESINFSHQQDIKSYIYSVFNLLEKNQQFVKSVLSLRTQKAVLPILGSHLRNLREHLLKTAHALLLEEYGTSARNEATVIYAFMDGLYSLYTIDEKFQHKKALDQFLKRYDT